jgi:serine protease Do
MDTPKQTPRDLSERIRHHRFTAAFALLATLSVGILAGSILTRSVSGKEQTIDSSDARPLTVPSPVFQSNEFSKIAKQVGPAVVNINTITLPKASTNRRSGRGGTQRGPLQLQPNPDDGSDQGNGQGSSQGDMQDFFNRFFGGQGGQGDDGNDSSSEREALGSGFIVDSRGYIITNNHVVDKADKIYVKLASDPENEQEHGRPAHVVGVDPATDIAVIKIDAPQPLPTVKLGNSDGAQEGDWVLAIGSPFSLSETVTAGIVSAKNRSIDDNPNGPPNQFQKFIQTDAAINPGNSGGPLVDMAGQVIGMNTAIYTQSMGSQGVGFAMPSNVIANIYNMLISPEHKVIRGSIGISFQSTPPSSAVGRIYGFANGGVLVNEVRPANGPAAKAGVKAGDVITSIDGKSIKDGDQLVADISARKVGSTAQLGILRSGANQTVTVTIADRDKLFADTGNPNAENAAPAESDAGEGKLGITVSAIPSALASKMGLKGGVIVNTVRPGSFADEINLTKGTVITAINRHPITDEASYKAAVSGLKSGDDVAFEVRDTRAGSGAGPSYLGNTLP